MALGLLDWRVLLDFLTENECSRNSATDSTLFENTKNYPTEMHGAENTAALLSECRLVGKALQHYCCSTALRICSVTSPLHSVLLAGERL